MHSLLSHLSWWVLCWLMSWLGKMHSITLDVRQVFSFCRFLEKFLFRNIFANRFWPESSLSVDAASLCTKLVLSSAEPKLQFVLLAGQRDSRRHRATCFSLCLKKPSFIFIFSHARRMESAAETVCVKCQAKYSSGELCGNRCGPKCLILSHNRCPLVLQQLREVVLLSSYWRSRFPECERMWGAAPSPCGFAGCFCANAANGTTAKPHNWIHCN